MADTTTRVQMGTVQWGDDKIYRVPAAVAKTFYPGMMIVLRNSSGNAVSCDDTAGNTFDGIMSESVNIVVNSGDTTALMQLDQSRQVPVERPFRFSMAITLATLGDEGKAVYALYDNQVAYSGTSNSILVGWVDQVLLTTPGGTTGTAVLIQPSYAPFAANAISNNTLTFTGATTVNQIVFPDATADALSFSDTSGPTEYLTFNSSTAGINAKVPLTVTSAGSGALTVGRLGATTPALQVDASTSTSTTGLSVKSAANTGGVALAAIGGNGNETFTIDAVGSGVIKIGSVSTGGCNVRVPIATVAAAGTAIGNAAAVSEGYTYVTAANNGNAVKLPAGAVGMRVTLVNAVYTATLQVFPQVNNAIDNLANNAVYNIPNGGERTFTYVAAGQWYCAPQAIV